MSNLKLFLIDVNKLRNFEESYDTLLVKSFSDLWDNEAALININFLESLTESYCFENRIKNLILKKNYRWRRVIVKILPILKKILAILMLITSILCFSFILYVSY